MIAPCCSAKTPATAGLVSVRNAWTCPADHTPSTAAVAMAGNASRNRPRCTNAAASRLLMRQWGRNQAIIDTDPSAAHSPDCSMHLAASAKRAAWRSCSVHASTNSATDRTTSSPIRSIVAELPSTLLVEHMFGTLATGTEYEIEMTKSDASPMEMSHDSLGLDQT